MTYTVLGGALNSTQIQSNQVPKLRLGGSYKIFAVSSGCQEYVNELCSQSKFAGVIIKMVVLDAGNNNKIVVAV